MSDKVTEAELVDVVLGGADRAQEERVLRAVAENPKLAALYDEWTRFIPIVREQVAPVKEMTARVQQRIHERLPFEFPALYTSSLPLKESEHRYLNWSSYKKRFKKVRQAALTIAAMFLAAILGALLMHGGAMFHNNDTAVAELMDNRIFARNARVLETGDEFTASGGNATLLRINNAAELNAHPGAQIYVESASSVSQSNGVVKYNITKATHSSRSGAFRVRVADGIVHTINSQFIVDLSAGRPGKVSVLQGEVILLNGNGAGVLIKEGQEKSLGADK